jgi:hypothetical protein
MVEISRLQLKIAELEAWIDVILSKLKARDVITADELSDMRKIIGAKMFQVGYDIGKKMEPRPPATGIWWTGNGWECRCGQLNAPHWTHCCECRVERPVEEPPAKVGGPTDAEIDEVYGMFKEKEPPAEEPEPPACFGGLSLCKIMKEQQVEEPGKEER